MNDIDRDARLLAALRHAPDADLAPPSHLGAQIVAAAHRASAEVASPAPPRRGGWLGGPFGRPWSLGASGALATFALAGVLGLLWRGERPGPAIEAAAEADAASAAPAAARPAASADAGAVAFGPAPAAAPTPMKAAAQAAHQAAPAAAVRAPVPAPEPAPVPTTAPVTAPPTAALKDSVAPAEADADKLRKAELNRQEASMSRRLREDALRQAAAAPASPTATAPAGRLADAMTSGSAVAAATAPPAAPAATSVAAPPVPVLAPAASVAAARETRAIRAAPANQAAIMAAPLPVAPWMDALAAGNRVRWRVNGQARSPTSSWLYALADQTQGRWRPANSSQPRPDDAEVQWLSGDQLLGRLWLGQGRVLWCDAQGRCEEAELDAEVGSSLRRGLAP